jgi:hypothetical protein
VKKRARMSADRLISGKLRAKAARRGASHTLVAVDGIDYAWAYRHGWVVWGKGVKALSLSVALHPGRTRELILDLTLKVGAEAEAPAEVRVLRALEAGIRSAREAGWDAESRGRAFRLEIAESL